MAFEALALATVAPALARDLGGIDLYGWVFSAFLLAQIVGAVAAGRRTDLDGPAKPFLASLALLGAGLLVGALAPNMLVLILARAPQGLGGALVALDSGPGTSGIVFALCVAPLLVVLAARAAYRLPRGTPHTGKESLIGQEYDGRVAPAGPRPHRVIVGRRG